MRGGAYVRMYAMRLYQKCLARALILQGLPHKWGMPASKQQQQHMPITPEGKNGQSR